MSIVLGWGDVYLKELFEKLCINLNIELDKTDTYTIKIMKSGFYVMFINHDQIKIRKILDEQKDKLLFLFKRDGAESNLESAYRYTLNGVRFLYDNSQ